jgi:MFS family permease
MMSVVAALAMWPGGIFADRYSERRAIAVGGFIMALTWGVVILSSTTSGFVVAFALAGVGQAFFGPAFSSLMSKAVPKGSLGITFGVFMTALGFMAVPAPIIGGLLYNNVAPTAPFVVAIVLGLVAVPLALRTLHRPAEASSAERSPRQTGETLSV